MCLSGPEPVETSFHLSHLSVRGAEPVIAAGTHGRNGPLFVAKQEEAGTTGVDQPWIGWHSTERQWPGPDLARPYKWPYSGMLRAAASGDGMGSPTKPSATVSRPTEEVHMPVTSSVALTISR